MAYAILGCNGIMVLMFFLRYQTLPPQVPLFYTHTAGEDQLAEWWMIFLLPVLLNLFYFINRFISNKFFPGNDFVKRLLNYLNITLMISVTIIFAKIIFLVT